MKYTFKAETFNVTLVSLSIILPHQPYVIFRHLLISYVAYFAKGHQVILVDLNMLNYFMNQSVQWAIDTTTKPVQWRKLAADINKLKKTRKPASNEPSGMAFCFIFLFLFFFFVKANHISYFITVEMYRDLTYPISWFPNVYFKASFGASANLCFHLCPITLLLVHSY